MSASGGSRYLAGSLEHILAVRIQTAPDSALALVKYQMIMTMLFGSYPAVVMTVLSGRRWLRTAPTSPLGTRIFPKSNIRTGKMLVKHFKK